MFDDIEQVMAFVWLCEVDQNFLLNVYLFIVSAKKKFTAIVNEVVQKN